MLFEKVYKQLLDYYLINEHVVDEVPRKVLGMSTSVVDLPDNRPYGFWVDRSGNFLQVRMYGHETGLEDILNRAKNHLEKKGITYNPSLTYAEMFKMGWCRIVLGNETVMFQMGSGQNPTSSQMKFMNFLKDMYELLYIRGD